MTKTNEEACCKLDLPSDTNYEGIDERFRESVDRLHQDVGDLSRSVEAQGLREASQVLCDHLPLHVGGANPSPTPTEANDCVPETLGTARPNAEIVLVVRKIMAANELVILGDQSIVVGSSPHPGFGPDEEVAWRSRPDDWNRARLSDAVTSEMRGTGQSANAADIRRAVDQVFREDQRDRENAVMAPLLFKPLDDAEQLHARAAWHKLVSTTLLIDTALGIGSLQHFMWLVKRRQLRLPVEHHLMPVITGDKQGSGKTTLLKRLVSPLQEFASAPVLLSELADPRSGDILLLPVVVVDDLEPIDARQVPVFKSQFTAEAVTRRPLGSSRAEKRQQRCTLIGTANEPICRLVADPTGHRRFVELPFRNGAVAKGGDPAVWWAVNETDYTLLWRSVDGFGPSPIRPHLAALAAIEAAAAPADELRECLVRLDPRSDEVQAITVRGGAGAEGLRLLVCDRLRWEIKPNMFSARMAVLVHDPAVPFGSKFRSAQGNVYPFKYLH